jgi:hypothetical protein
MPPVHFALDILEMGGFSNCISKGWPWTKIWSLQAGDPGKLICNSSLSLNSRAWEPRELLV